jgi:hypothetical protein
MRDTVVAECGDKGKGEEVIRLLHKYVRLHL